MGKKLRKLATYYKPYMSLFLADMFFAIIGAAVTLVIPLIVRYITGNVIMLEPQEALHKILMLGLVMLGLVLLECYCNYFISKPKLNMICAPRFSDIIRSCLFPFLMTRR